MRIRYILLPILIGSLALSCVGQSTSMVKQNREYASQPIQATTPPKQGTNNPLSTPSPVLVIREQGQSQTKYGDILVLANRSDPPTGFDTLRTSSIALHHVGGALFGPGNLVMRCRENMYLICPYLANSWVSNLGFTEWTFTIRNNITWHDGTPFTAHDVKFWLDLAHFGINTAEQIRAPAYFKGELGSINRVEVLRDNRVLITFANRNPHLLEILANPRFKIAHPSHLMRSRIDKGESSLTPLDIGLVGLGPFVLERYERGSVIRLRKFSQYWEKDRAGLTLPYLAGIDYVIIPDPFVMDAAFRTGRLDGGARGQPHHLTQERKEGYIRDLEGEVLFAEIDGGAFRLAFNNLKYGPWQNPEVRRAIALVIDKQASITSALGGFGWTSPDLGPPNLLIPRHFINWPKFDLAPIEEKRAKATEIIAQAGYRSGFSMGHLCRAVNPTPCEFLKAQLSLLNIDLRLQMVEEGEWNRARVSLDYDSQQGRLTPSPIPEGSESVYGRYSSNPDAYAKHEDPKVDELYERLRNALTFDLRVEIWREIQRYLFVEQTYIIPIAESVNVVPYRTYVRGLTIPPEDKHTHTDFTTVWLDKQATTQ